MSLKGLGEIRDQDYMTIDDFHEILQKLDKQTGSYVKSLIVPDFLTIDDIRPFAIHCSNIEDLDLESFMHRIGECLLIGCILEQNGSLLRVFRLC